MAKRKSLSKKTRFEIFKRDQFTCQYCGSTPPHVVLHVDHINPVANGGDNSDDNLITSCDSCNQGKAANLLTDIPKSLKQKASEIKERELQIREYNKIIQAKKDRIETEAWEIVATLESRDVEEYSASRLRSIRVFIERIGFHEVEDAAEITADRFRTISHSAFKYFCGICWNKAKRIEDA